MVTVKWSKTSQYVQCKNRVKLLSISHVLSPVEALKTALDLYYCEPGNPAFLINSQGTPMSGQLFTPYFKKLVLRCGLNPRDYGVIVFEGEVPLGFCSVALLQMSLNL